MTFPGSRNCSSRSPAFPTRPSTPGNRAAACTASAPPTSPSPAPRRWRTCSPLTDELEDKKVQEQFLELVNSEVPKVVVLLGEFIDLPKCLKPYTLRSKHQMRKAG